MKRLGLILALALAGCGQSDNNHWLGYAEGDYAYISAPQAGWVVQVAVKRGDFVSKGQVLFTLDDTSQVAARDTATAQIAQAEGQLVQAKATLDLAQKELVRQTGLLQSHATSQQNYDQAKSTEETAAAQVAQIIASENQARASLTNATYQLTQRQVISQTAGRVEDVYFRQGEYAPAMTPVIEVLPPENVYVRFFVPESDLSRLRLNEAVLIDCDGCKPIEAKVAFIASQEEFTPPVIFSISSRDKLVFKAEARLPGGLKLNPGQPVDVRPVGAP
jgi:HlyD family secretion protein